MSALQRLRDAGVDPQCFLRMVIPGSLGQAPSGQRLLPPLPGDSVHKPRVDAAAWILSSASPSTP